MLLRHLLQYLLNPRFVSRPENITGIAERYGLNGEEVLENISVARVYTTEHMIELLKKAAGLMITDSYALIIIDSIMALFRTEFSGRGELSERQQVLGKFLGRLMKVAEQFNVAVFMTNQGIFLNLLKIV